MLNIEFTPLVIWQSVHQWDESLGLQPKSHPGQMAGIHMSLDLYMSDRSLVMGTLPIVFLKNTSSMVEGLTERREGRSRRSFPKRQGWVGYLKDISQWVKSAPFCDQCSPSKWCTKRLIMSNEADTCAQSQRTQWWGVLLINFRMNLSKCSQQELMQNNWRNERN